MPALLLLASALWLSQAPPSPQPVKDSTELALDAAGLTYTKLPAFYQLPFTLAESRRQTVYVRRVAETYKSVGINEAFAICYESGSEPSAEMLQKTFLRRFTIGGLVLEALRSSTGTSSSGLSYITLFDHPNNRKRTIFVGVKPSTIEDLTVHTVYTTVWTGKEPPGQDLMQKALLSAKKFGFFYLFQDAKSMWALRFGANAIVGPTKAETLRDLIYFVNQVGEETELSLSAPK